MMTGDQLLAFLRNELADEGLLAIRFYQHGGILFRTRCELPYMTMLDEHERFADHAEVLLFRDGDDWYVRMEHPNPGRVLHPNWDANGYWHSDNLRHYGNTTPEEMCDLLRGIIRSLNFNGDAYSLVGAVNRNAVAWCYANGKDNRRINLVSSTSARPRSLEHRETRRIQINLNRQ